METTALKKSFIMDVGCIKGYKGKNWILGCLEYINMQYYFAHPITGFKDDRACVTTKTADRITEDG